MFTIHHTFEEIMNTEPVRRSIGCLFPSCWTACISPQQEGCTMKQISEKIRMESGLFFDSEAFTEAADILLEAAHSRRFLFVPLWKHTPPGGQENWIPESDLNNQEGVWLFTGNPAMDNTAFASTAAGAPVPPEPAPAVSFQKHTDAQNRPAVIICPGGGYEMLSSYFEGVQLAQRMERDGGYKAFLLNYRISPNRYPLPQMDLALAVMHVRLYADQYQIDPARILVLGASAGGHLCASEAFLHETLKQQVLSHPQMPAGRYETISARPDGAGLLYPVVSFLSEYHEGSYQNLAGTGTDLHRALSVELHITSDYPPVYAFAATDDACVPVSNTIRLEQALEQAGVPHLCEIYPSGGHGIGLGYGSSCENWSGHMLKFFEQIF